MTWQEIRAQYPSQWLLVEAIKAHTEGDQRILDQLSVLSSYVDSVVAMRAYSKQHHETPERELYVFHTSRETLEVFERQWMGIRVAQ